MFYSSLKIITYAVLLVVNCQLFAQTVNILTNIKGYTPTKQREIQSFTTIAMLKGKVIKVGDEHLLSEFPNATIIDGKNQFVLPGLIDGHGHLLNLGYVKMTADLVGLHSLAETLSTLKKYQQKNPERDWLLGQGWNQELWEDNSYPTRQELDWISKTQPIWLKRIDGHAGWANSVTLKLAGIDGKTMSPYGGKIIHDNQGEPTGVLVDNAMQLVDSIIPPFTTQQKEQALQQASNYLLSLGITSLHDAGIDFSTYQLYKRKAVKQALKVRIYAMINANEPQLVPLLRSGPVDLADDFLSIRSVKAYIDGALGSHGAALLGHYADQPQQSGLLLYSRKEIEQLFNITLRHNFQLNLHAIGDHANRIVLDLFKQYQELPIAYPLRHRIEHAQIIHPDDIQRFSQAKVIASIQPLHATSDRIMAQQRLSKKQLAGAYPWQSLLQQDVRIVAGSDFPVEPANPFFGLHAAVTRQGQDNQPAGGWLPKEKMTLAQAFFAFTLDAAYAAHQESILGSLEPGKWADFIMVDRNIFKINPEELWQTQVLSTWIAGKQRYAAE